MMHTRYLYFLIILNFQVALAQWQPMGKPSTYSVTTLFKHHDKAYASVKGTLSVAYKDEQGSMGYFPVDMVSRSHLIAHAWGDLVLTGTMSGAAFVYSDVSIGQKLNFKSLGAGEIKSIATIGSKALFGCYGGLVVSEDSLKSAVKVIDGIRPVSVNDLKVFGAMVYAATDSGVYYSESQGLSWKRFAASRRAAHAVHLYDDTLYIGNRTGLYYSSDKGVTWLRDSTFLDEEILTLKETEHALWLFDHNRVFRKKHGQRWQQVYPSLPGKYTHVLELGRTTYIASYWGTAYQEDGGPWITIPLPGATFEGSITNMTFDGSKILAGTDIRGVFASADQGRSWSHSSPPFHKGAVYGMQSTHIGVGAWYASSMLGLYRSRDQGQSWFNITPKQLGRDPSINAIRTFGDTLWICTHMGLYYSMDEGNSWWAPLQGPEKAYDLIRMPSGKMYASGSETLLEAQAPYQTWSPSSLNASYFTYRMAQYGDTLYVSTGGGGIYRSFDGGQLWNSLHTGLSNRFISEVEINAQYAAIVDGMSQLYVLSHDKDSWTPFLTARPPGFVGAIAIHSNTLYAAEQFGGLWRRALADYDQILNLEEGGLAKNVGSSPNPFHNRLQINNWESIAHLELMDEMGRKVKNLSPAPSIDLSSLPQGLYLLQYIDLLGGRKVEKIVKE